MEFRPKQELYKTAFCPRMNRYVGLQKAIVVEGEWMFRCRMGDKIRWMAESELENFVL